MVKFIGTNVSKNINNVDPKGLQCESFWSVSVLRSGPVSWDRRDTTLMMKPGQIIAGWSVFIFEIEICAISTNTYLTKFRRDKKAI